MTTWAWLCRIGEKRQRFDPWGEENSHLIRFEDHIGILVGSSFTNPSKNSFNCGKRYSDLVNNTMVVPSWCLGLYLPYIHGFYRYCTLRRCPRLRWYSFGRVEATKYRHLWQVDLKLLALWFRFCRSVNILRCHDLHTLEAHNCFICQANWVTWTRWKEW